MPENWTCRRRGWGRPHHHHPHRLATGERPPRPTAGRGGLCHIRHPRPWKRSYNSPPGHTANPWFEGAAPPPEASWLQSRTVGTPGFSPLPPTPSLPLGNTERGAPQRPWWPSRARERLSQLRLGLRVSHRSSTRELGRPGFPRVVQRRVDPGTPAPSHPA